MSEPHILFQPRSMQNGCLRPLMASAAAIVLLGAVLVGAYWDTFVLMGENVRVMGEGRQIASQMRSPDDLLAYLEAHPELASLVAYDVEAPEAGIYYGSRTRRPVAGVPDLLLVAEYARQVEAGLADPSARVLLAELEALVLPGTDGGTHARARAALAEAGAVDADTAVALQDVVEAMVRWNDHAASDALIARLGREAVAALPGRLGYATLDPPLPDAGLYLSWSNHTLQATPEQRLIDLQAHSPADYAREVHALAETYRNDGAFRRREVEQRTRSGTDLSLREQRSLARARFPRGTAHAYADLVARALRDSLLAPGVSARIRAALDRSVPDTSGVRLSVVGAMGGSFPGLISFVGYARRDDGRSPRVVALLVEGLPISVFYHLLQTGLDKGLVVQLLGDDAYFDRARLLLSEQEE